jgi:hypothetical protein
MHFLFGMTLEQGGTSSPLLFNFALGYEIRKIRENEKGSELNGTRHLLFNAGDVNVLGESINAIKKNTEALLVASKEDGLEVNSETTEYIYGCVSLPKCRTESRFTDS